MRKIEIDYNPYLPNCEMLIDGGEMIDEYSMLFPVCKYPLQAWLEKKRSWPGLAYQLLSLIRGEMFSLLFRGRKEDYDDLYQVLIENENIKNYLSHIDYESKYERKEIENRVNFIHNLVINMWNIQYPGIGSKKDNIIIGSLNEQFARLNGLSSLVTLDDVSDSEARGILKKLSVPVVFETISKDNALLEIKKLFRNTMHRSADSIIIYEVSVDKYYLYSNPNIECDPCILDMSKSKYGIPYMVGQKVSIYTEIIKYMCQILDGKSSLVEEFEKYKNDDDLSDEEYNKLAGCIKWINKNEKNIYELERRIKNVWEGL